MKEIGPSPMKTIANSQTKLTISEQFLILNGQLENLYNLVAATNKFYSVLCSSIVGVAILLYSNGVLPSEYFNYLYYITILMYAISIIWYRNLSVYLLDLNCKSDAYNQFIEKHAIISMYNSSFSVNTRKTNMVIPFLLGGLICCILIKYSNWSYVKDCLENNQFNNLMAWKEILMGLSYLLVFYLGFIRNFDLRIFKSF